MDELSDDLLLARLRNNFPDLSDEELADAKEALDQYFDLALRIFNQILSDPIEYAKFCAELDEMKKQENQGNPA